MPIRIQKTGERILPETVRQSKEAYLLYLRHLFSYEAAKVWLSPENLVVEIGCGEGYGTQCLSQHVRHITGLDVDAAIIAYASEKYGSEQCAFSVYDGVTLPYEDQTFDMVVTFETIEHIKDDARFLAELYRVIKDGGQCLLTTPNGLSRLSPGQKPWNRFHIREYAPAELRNLLASVFSDVEIWGIIGTDEIQAIEQSRVEQAQRFAALDPLNLRRWLPPAWETWIVTLVKNLLRPEQTSEAGEDFLNKYSVDDYCLTQQALDESFDLLARCKK